MTLRSFQPEFEQAFTYAGRRSDIYNGEPCTHAPAVVGIVQADRTPAAEASKKSGVSEQSIDTWRKKMPAEDLEIDVMQEITTKK